MRRGESGRDRLLRCGCHRLVVFCNERDCVQNYQVFDAYLTVAGCQGECRHCASRQSPVVLHGVPPCKCASMHMQSCDNAAAFYTSIDTNGPVHASRA